MRNYSLDLNGNTFFHFVTYHYSSYSTHRFISFTHYCALNSVNTVYNLARSLLIFLILSGLTSCPVTFCMFKLKLSFSNFFSISLSSYIEFCLSSLAFITIPYDVKKLFLGAILPQLI